MDPTLKNASIFRTMNPLQIVTDFDIEELPTPFNLNQQSENENRVVRLNREELTQELAHLLSISDSVAAKIALKRMNNYIDMIDTNHQNHTVQNWPNISIEQSNFFSVIPVIRGDFKEFIDDSEKRDVSGTSAAFDPIVYTKARNAIIGPDRSSRKNRLFVDVERKLHDFMKPHQLYPGKNLRLTFKNDTLVFNNFGSTGRVIGEYSIHSNDSTISISEGDVYDIVGFVVVFNQMKQKNAEFRITRKFDLTQYVNDINNISTNTDIRVWLAEHGPIDGHVFAIKGSILEIDTNVGAFLFDRQNIWANNILISTLSDPIDKEMFVDHVIAFEIVEQDTNHISNDQLVQMMTYFYPSNYEQVHILERKFKKPMYLSVPIVDALFKGKLDTGFWQSMQKHLLNQLVQSKKEINHNDYDKVRHYEHIISDDHLQTISSILKQIPFYEIDIDNSRDLVKIIETQQDHGSAFVLHLVYNKWVQDIETLQKSFDSFTKLNKEFKKQYKENQKELHCGDENFDNCFNKWSDVKRSKGLSKGSTMLYNITKDVQVAYYWGKGRWILDKDATRKLLKKSNIQIDVLFETTNEIITDLLTNDNGENGEGVLKGAMICPQGSLLLLEKINTGDLQNVWTIKNQINNEHQLNTMPEPHKSSSLDKVVENKFWRRLNEKYDDDLHNLSMYTKTARYTGFKSLINAETVNVTDDQESTTDVADTTIYSALQNTDTDALILTDSFVEQVLVKIMTLIDLKLDDIAFRSISSTVNAYEKPEAYQLSDDDLKKQSFKEVIKVYVRDKNIDPMVFKNQSSLEAKKIFNVIRANSKYQRKMRNIQALLLKKSQLQYQRQALASLLAILTVFIQCNYPHIRLKRQDTCSTVFGLQGHPLNDNPFKPLYKYLICIAQTLEPNLIKPEENFNDLVVTNINLVLSSNEYFQTKLTFVRNQLGALEALQNDNHATLIKYQPWISFKPSILSESEYVQIPKKDMSLFSRVQRFVREEPSNKDHTKLDEIGPMRSKLFRQEHIDKYENIEHGIVYIRHSSEKTEETISEERLFQKRFELLGPGFGQASMNTNVTNSKDINILYSDCFNALCDPIAESIKNPSKAVLSEISSEVTNLFDSFKSSQTPFQAPILEKMFDDLTNTQDIQKMNQVHDILKYFFNVSVPQMISQVVHHNMNNDQVVGNKNKANMITLNKIHDFYHQKLRHVLATSFTLETKNNLDTLLKKWPKIPDSEVQDNNNVRNLYIRCMFSLLLFLRTMYIIYNIHSTVCVVYNTDIRESDLGKKLVEALVHELCENLSLKQVGIEDLKYFHERQREEEKQRIIKEMDKLSNEDRRSLIELKKRGLVDVKTDVAELFEESDDEVPNVPVEDVDSDDDDNDNDGEIRDRNIMDEDSDVQNDFNWGARGENDSGDESGQDDF